ncbi:type II toxin-antitoxin system MqsA family antitoxin [Pseudomonas sp. C6002]|uniref:type II toxin-antitoxin system MqsA family antitoxin n=1 Tax=Pseudomonas sp. C6002 TaxID=2738814 RepID=UPI0015A38163|nr:type II toxin-antitoxin system MqsA family antitoxin [Pseudomonas sp. C6002]NWA32715.1 type II toxin-antitoxin system MqsA family antitoxin [Pseudomonas sp. C6002]
MNNLEICPVCCEGHLHSYHFSREISYKNVTCMADVFESSKCDTCGSCVATHAQTKYNKLLNINFQRAVDGLLSTHEVHRIRKKLKLSQRVASSIIGGGGNAFSKYESGVIKQSVAVDNMLRVLDLKPALIEVLVQADEQRRALASVQTEIYIPPAIPQKPADSPVFSFFKEVVMAAQTAFLPTIVEQTINSPLGLNAINFEFCGSRTE